jgi:hypothetical protein
MASTSIERYIGFWGDLVIIYGFTLGDIGLKIGAGFETQPLTRLWVGKGEHFGM